MSRFTKNIHFKKIKGKSLLKFILIFIGATALLWYLAPLAARIFNIGNALGTIASTALILFGVFYDKIPIVPKKIIISLVGVFLVIFVIPISFNMAKYANYKADSGAETVIVLGCKVNGTRPSKYLYDRCCTAAEYLEKNPNSSAVLSGGQGPDEGISEAECMKNTLIEMGIDEKRLYLEDKSTNTRENISFSKKIIDENNLSANVLVVTNEFHEYRSKLICDKCGLNFSSKSSRSSFYTFLTFYTRELLSIANQILFN